MTVTLTPRVDFHLEAHSDDCICEKLSGCGGIKNAQVLCPEHGYSAAFDHFHTHAKQVDKVTRGRWVQ